MAMKFVPMETRVIIEDDFIIFTKVSEDEWAHGTYCYHVQMYRPMYLADNSTMIHPSAYRNAEAYRFAQRKQWGFISFIDAYNTAQGKMNQYIKQYGDG